MVILLFSPGMEFGEHTVETVLPTEGEIQRYRIERNGKYSILYCRICKTATGEHKAAFEARARALAALTNRHLPQVEGAGYAPLDGFYWIRVSAPTGKSLRELLDEDSGPPEAADCLGLFCAVAAALEWVGERSYAHFGLTPSHIYVLDGGKLEVVMGLGIRMVLDAGRAVLRLDERVYRAPEQLRQETADYRADIYALGMILYELLAGDQPYADQFAKVGIKEPSAAPHSSVSPILESVMPTSLCEAVDLEEVWNTFVFSLIAKVPAMRPPTWKHVLAEFERITSLLLIEHFSEGSAEKRKELEHSLSDLGALPLSSLAMLAEQLKSESETPVVPTPTSEPVAPVVPSPTPDPAALMPDPATPPLTAPDPLPGPASRPRPAVSYVQTNARRLAFASCVAAALSALVLALFRIETSGDVALPASGSSAVEPIPASVAPAEEAPRSAQALAEPARDFSAGEGPAPPAQVSLPQPAPGRARWEPAHRGSEREEDKEQSVQREPLPQRDAERPTLFTLRKLWREEARGGRGGPSR